MKKSGAEPSASSAEHTDHSPESQTGWSVATFACRTVERRGRPRAEPLASSAEHTDHGPESQAGWSEATR
jgi:hypothetical protein